MWEWLSGLIGVTWSDVNSAYQYIIQIIQTVYNYIAAEIGMVYQTISGIASWVSNVLSSLYQSIYNGILGLANGLLQLRSWITSWVTGLWNDLKNFGNYLWQQITSLTDWVKNEITRIYNDVTSWVMRDIFDPLNNFISNIYSTIARIAGDLYGFIQHPDRILAFLGAYLLKFWLSMLLKFGRPIGSFILRNAEQDAGVFVQILENILSAIL